MQMKSKIRRLLYKRASCIVHPHIKHTELPVTCIDACLCTPCSETNRERERERERERGGRGEKRREEERKLHRHGQQNVWTYCDVDSILANRTGKSFCITVYRRSDINGKQRELYNYKCNRRARNRYLGNETTFIIHCPIDIRMKWKDVFFNTESIF